MADITANVDAWSSTESSNNPSGATTVGTGLDDNLRAIQAGVVVYKERINHPENLALACSVSSNALTIAIKGKDGNDPSSTNKVRIPFRNATAATGDYAQLVLTSATSLVLSNGSTLGTVASVPNRYWIVGFNDAGTFRLGAINCALTVAGQGAGRDVTVFSPLAGWGIASSTAEGGLGGADSAGVFYTGSAVSSKAYTVLGYLTYESGLGTAGVYASAPTRVQPWIQGMPLPGQVLQTIVGSTAGTSSTGTTAVPADDTIPQIGEGDSYIDPNDITCSSAANVLRIRAQAQFANSNATQALAASIHKTGTNNAYATGMATATGANEVVSVGIEILILAEATTAQDFELRAGGSTGATTTFNGSAGNRLYGGVINSYVIIEELMG